MKKIVWVVSLFVECKECNERWYLKGVYETEQLAVKACTKDNYSIIPVEMNVGTDKMENYRGYYPLLETQEEALERFKSLPRKI